MGKIGLIIQREYLTRVKKKSFLLMTILGPLLLAGVVALVAYLGFQDDKEYDILVVDDSGGAFKSMENGENFTFHYIDGLGIEEAKDSFKDSEYSVILHLPDGILAQKRPILYFKEQPSMSVEKSIEARIENLVEREKLKLYDISYADYKRIKTEFSLTMIKFTESGEEETVTREKALVGFFFGLAVYLFIFLYGVQVMRGVIEEKNNRIVEVIISSVKPFQLMMGKIVGIALVGLTQFVLWIVLSFTFITVTQQVLFQDKMESLAQQQVQKSTELSKQTAPKQIQADVDFSDLTNPNHIVNRINWPLMLSLFLFYFIGGYLLYSALFAAIGSAVDNDTDTQQFMLPVTAPLIVAYFIAFTLMENPESDAAFWASLIPFTSPIIMIERVAIGLSPNEYWELGLSMVLLVLGFIFTTWLAGKIYRTGVLMYGKKVNYKELWKWIRYHD
ncbi:ABC transporter permease [Salibacter halophilus]|uniref:ABC transporter permease n=1 Tax=Salibacter halophilus TaxID=1803916 RepID=A0A6N6MEW0_9FLAO|nr:ABC transporter permease [Salibacter halophilus]KAB1066255.1 ABC transporter permease [Salibacter halophilus]